MLPITFFPFPNKRFYIAVVLAFILASCDQSPRGSVTEQHKSTIEVTDYLGNSVMLNSPAKKIVALAPHLVENVYSAGAGDQLIAVVVHSDFPEQAKSLPVVGGYQTINLEEILALQPDLVLAWDSGNSNANINSLRELGLTVYVDRTKTLEGIARTIQDIGVLAGTSDTANEVSNDFLTELDRLRTTFKDARKISTFYQVWNKPLRTINGQHVISATIELCGGTNIFADLAQVAPVINVEAIIEQDPEAIIASGTGDSRPDWLDEWQQWQSLQAVQKDALFFVHPDHIQRHTIRILEAARSVCRQLDQLR